MKEKKSQRVQWHIGFCAECGFLKAYLASCISLDDVRAFVQRRPELIDVIELPVYLHLVALSQSQSAHDYE